MNKKYLYQNQQFYKENYYLLAYFRLLYLYEQNFENEYTSVNLELENEQLI